MKSFSKFVLGDYKVKGNGYTIGYAAILGGTCALLLTAVTSFTRPFQDANRNAERQRNILNVLEVSYSEDISSGDLVKVFEDNVKLEWYGELQSYNYTNPQGQSTLAFELEGSGLWGPIKGFLSLESDMLTIKGITFHEQEETPGLGGEIGAKWFRDQFVGKKMVDSAGKPGIVIGGPEAQNQVDGITGATMTCDKVEQLINVTIEKIVKETK
jgi:Na+-transporting NADH:ubiquinone oxidoreductase subunit C